MSEGNSKRNFKRLIVCCDGTWNSADSGAEGVPSNVALLSRMLAKVGTTQVRTEKGMETVEIDQYFHAFLFKTTFRSNFRQDRTGTGAGVEDHVIQAYHFIATNYNVNDEVFLFGFSRGAYTARAVGGLLTQMGLLDTVDLVHFNRLYRCFQEGRTSETKRELKYYPCSKTGGEIYTEEQKLALLEKESLAKSTEKYPKQLVFYTPTIPPKPETGIIRNLKVYTGWAKDGKNAPLVLTQVPSRIDLEVIGVWDTVGALGMPESILSKTFGANKGKDFGDTALNEHVKRAYQALSLDDHRGAFTPSLWYLKDPLDLSAKEGEKPAVETKDLTHSVDLRQCWFPGFHADIGGGCDTDDTFNDNQLAHSISQISLAWMCDQIDGLVTFREDVGLVFLPDPEPNLDWMARKTKDPMTRFYQLNTGGGSHLRTPGTYNRKDLILSITDEGKEINESEKEGSQDISDQHTRERMHPSIRLLMEATAKYGPKGSGPAPKKHYDPPAFHQVKSMTWSEVSPGWKHENRGTGDGVYWSRPRSRPSKWSYVPSFIGEWKGTRPLILDEHVIVEHTEDPTKHNFEARLLTKEVKTALNGQNANKIAQIKEAKKQVEEYQVGETGQEPSEFVKHANWWFKCTEHGKTF
ncbi:hypothetical protein G7Y89_g8814 [Cudoniella acicularis]|uniref:T6SS Phospholipase effector Tle1-like catalytic domain-containing protein n=1 Tax=Cudoniella acicularis TaxID=354080 RepID=A0A8H4RFW1_9HELO|nr:hypothetical protein G7Y89_g8814 [Cudoniella acicularis]